MKRPTGAELLRETAAIHFRLRSCGVSAADLDEVTADVIAAAWESITRGLYQPDPGAKPRSVLSAWLQGIAWRRANTIYGRAYRVVRSRSSKCPRRARRAQKGSSWPGMN